MANLGLYMNSQYNRFPMLTYKLPWHDLVHVFYTLSAARTARLPFFWVHKDTHKCYTLRLSLLWRGNF